MNWFEKTRIELEQALEKMNALMRSEEQSAWLREAVDAIWETEEDDEK